MDSEPPRDEDFNWPVISTHAKAIGLLCIYTATLDNAIVRLIGRMLEVDEKTTACVTASAPDISHRCEMAKRLVHIKAPNQQWRVCVTGLLNLTQEVIGPKRNRYVHDDWYVTGDDMVRLDTRVRVQKPGSFKEAELVHVTKSTQDVAEINDLTMKASGAALHLELQGANYENWRAGKLLQALPERAIQLSKWKVQGTNQRDG